jgi:hypothetical protein
MDDTTTGTSSGWIMSNIGRPSQSFGSQPRNSTPAALTYFRLTAASTTSTGSGIAPMSAAKSISCCMDSLVGSPPVIARPSRAPGVATPAYRRAGGQSVVAVVTAAVGYGRRNSHSTGSA